MTDVERAFIEGFEFAIEHAEIFEHDGWVRCGPFNDWTYARKKLAEECNRRYNVPADGAPASSSPTG